mgnify:CR=1 FL=1|jgi:murein DD-endopeptidase MepM/ murein hydrolase activator NlpD
MVRRPERPARATLGPELGVRGRPGSVLLAAPSNPTLVLRALWGHARLAKFRLERALLTADAPSSLEPIAGAAQKKLIRSAGRFLPSVLIAGATIACGMISKGDSDPGMVPVLMPPSPELAKKAPGKWSRETPWSYVLPVDHGFRRDKSGDGSFRAPRFHGEHNGIDLLAPIGTPTFAACTGKALASVSRSFGNAVQVICPVPEGLWAGRGPEPWVSFFYAHLQQTDLPKGKWIEVERGQRVGTIGKTGNARGAEIQPHLHLELIVQKNMRSAMDERHLGADQSDSPAAAEFAERIHESCLDPAGFRPKSNQLTRARRLDPFVALTCLSGAKPEYEKAPEPLGFASTEWSRIYVARRFNVNRGPE